MSYPTTGTCQCGEVHYKIRNPPIFTVVCHCTDCQKYSGGAIGITMMVQREDFMLIRGKLQSFDRPADSGATARCYFCPQCGNRIYHEDPDKPQLVRLKPGTLDDTSMIKPEMHVWTCRAQPWFPLPTDLPCHAKQPDIRSLIKQ